MALENLRIDWSRHRSQTIRETVYETIKTAILTGVLAFGQELTEDELAESLRVSRTPVREAFHALQLDGFLEIRPGRGLQVTSLDAEDVLGQCDLRALLEGYAARMAASRIEPDTLMRMQWATERMGRAHAADEREVASSANLEFHALLIEAAGVPVLARLASLLWKSDSIIVRHRAYRKHPGQGVRDHRAIIAALRTRDAAAAEAAVHEHIGHRKERLIEFLRELESAPKTAGRETAPAEPARARAPAAGRGRKART